MTAAAGRGAPITDANGTRWTSRDGVGYRVHCWGSGPPLVMLHGFTGAASGWSDLAGDLGHRWTVVAPDLLGHGETDAPPDPARFAVERQVEDLAGLLDHVAPGPVAVLGYSMGARMALAFAVAHPDRVSCLVLESGTAGIESDDERAARRAADDALADRIERNGIAAFVAEWEALPLWRSQATLPEGVRRRQRETRLANRPEGLASSLRGSGQGVQPPLWQALTGLPMPLLAIAGALDRKYAGIAERIGASAQHGRTVVIAEAGHAPHLERPEEFRDAVERFLLDCKKRQTTNRGDDRCR